MRHINKDNLFDFAFLNEDTLKIPIKGICVSFHGFTDATMFDESSEQARILGESGIAWLHPYYSVWGWMSENSQLFNEQVIDAAYDRLGADESIPLIISGGSMGGLTALNYLVRGKRRASACALNCPVTDMSEFYNHSISSRRAILSAHIEKDCPLDIIMRNFSPVNFADKLPNIPYFLIFGENDTHFVDYQMPPMEEKLKQYNRNYTLTVHPKMEHCDIRNHPKALKEYCDFIISAATDCKHMA